MHGASFIMRRQKMPFGDLPSTALEKFSSVWAFFA